MKENARRARMMRGFGKRLRAARITGGWDSAGDFAAFLGLIPQRYTRYERGEVMAPVDVLEDFSKHLDITLDWLLLGRQKVSPPPE